MHALADRVHADHPALGILVNNAGVGMTGPFTAASEQDWNWIRSVNLDGVVNGCAVFAPAMLAQRRGHVVNLSSGLAYANTAMEPLYGATKAAVLALSRSLRADWATQGVGVTAVCPGVINTPIITTTRYLGTRDTDEVRAFAAEQFGRGHPPEQVASGIIAAIEHDRPVAPVGFESWLVYAMSRLLPSRATQWVLARTPPILTSDDVRPPRSGRDSCHSAIWAGVLANSRRSRPDRAAAGQAVSGATVADSTRTRSSGATPRSSPRRPPLT